MNDLISRQAAIDAVISLCDDCDSDYCGSCRVNYPGEKDCRKVLEDLPSVQPKAEQSEIIRCRDCKFWTHIKRTNRYWCKTDDGLYDLNPSPDDFCSKAERRTDE